MEPSQLQTQENAAPATEHWDGSNPLNPTLHYTLKPKPYSLQTILQHIKGNEFALAQNIVGLTDGKDALEHRQPCPLCQSWCDSFYFQNEDKTFHCQDCGFNGDIRNLVSRAKKVSVGAVIDIIWEALQDLTAEADTTSPVPEQEQSATIVRSDHKGNVALDGFVKSGEWQGFLCNLEAIGWWFFGNGKTTHFQTPNGDHTDGAYNGQIVNGVVSFFSDVPDPFEEGTDYTIPELFAGALYGNIGEDGIAQFVEEYLSEAPTQQPFPVDCLPPVLRDFVIEGAKSANTDPAYFIAFVLPIIASLIGSRYVLVAKEDWLIPSIVWVMLIADSGSGKTPAMNKATEYLKKLQIGANDVFEAAMQMYETKQKEYDVDCAQWRADRKKNKALPPPPTPTPPLRAQYYTIDTTTEALIELLSENEDGVFLGRDEIAGLVGGFDAYRSGTSKDEAVFNEIFDGNYAQVNRKSGNKKFIAAKHTHTSICGGIQPEKLKAVLRDNPSFLYSGLMARFLVVMPPDDARPWSDSNMPTSVKTAYQQLFDTLLAWRSYQMVMSPDNPYRVEMTEEARRLFIENYNSLAADRVSLQSGILKASLSKMVGYAGRIAIVLHIAEYASRLHNKPFPGRIPPVEKETMNNAIQITQWFIEQSQRVIRQLCPQPTAGSNGSASIAHGAAEALELAKRRGEITKADLHNLQVFKKASNPAEAIDVALTELRSCGLLVSEFVRHASGGRPKEVFRYVSGFGSATDCGTIENPDENEGSTSTVNE
jgi:hypothetical protein